MLTRLEFVRQMRLAGEKLSSVVYAFSRASRMLHDIWVTVYVALSTFSSS